MRLVNVAKGVLRDRACLERSPLHGGRSHAQDPGAGDKIAPALTGDIAKVTFTTKGTGSGRSYQPKALVVIMELNDSVSTSRTTEYGVEAEIAGCGYLFLATSAGAVNNAAGGSLGCGERGLEASGTFTPLSPQIAVKGKTITFTVRFSDNPQVLRAGAAISSAHPFTAFVDPVLGVVGPAMNLRVTRALANSALYVDEAKTAATYRVG